MNKSLIKEAMILTVITLISGVALGFVYEITKEPIAASEEAAVQAAYKEVFETADTFTDIKGFNSTAATKVAANAGYTDDTVDNCVTAIDADGKTLGYVITVTSSAGYAGDITLSMGVTKAGKMNGYSITTINETAGLGMKAKEDAFKNQFNNISAGTLEVIKSTPASKSQIEAISGATITSRAVTNAVNAGFAYYNSINKGGSDDE